MQQVSKVLVQHVRHPFNASRYIGTVAAVVHLDGKVTTGFSQCHHNDLFDKHIGREKAVGRALSGRALNKHGEPLTPVPLKAYNPDGSRYRLRPVEGALLLLEDKAKKLPKVWEPA